jgi:hypothetical protein
VMMEAQRPRRRSSWRSNFGSNQAAITTTSHAFCSRKWLSGESSRGESPVDVITQPGRRLLNRAGNSASDVTGAIREVHYGIVAPCVHFPICFFLLQACAPRYVWFSQTLSRRDPVGTCYVARNSFREYSEYSPCRTRE